MNTIHSIMYSFLFIVSSIHTLEPVNTTTQRDVLVSVENTPPKKHSNRKETMSELLSKVDDDVPPNYEEDIPTDVTIQIYIVSLDTISENTMDYSVSMYLRQQWMDTRMSHPALPGVDFLELDAVVMKQVCFMGHGQELLY